MRAVLVVALALVAPLGAQQVSDVAGMGKVSADEPVSLALRAPVRWIARALAEARAILPDEMEGPIGRALADAADDAGFALSDPEKWVGVGLDPDGDLAFSLGEPGGWIRLPQRLRASLPALDVDRLGRLLVERRDSSEPMEPIDGGGMTGAGMAFGAIGKTLVVVGHDGGRDADAMVEELAAAIEAFGAGQTVGGTTVYRSVAARIGDGAWGALFVRPSRWLAADEEPSDSEPLVESFLLAAGARSAVAALHLKPSDERTRLLERGADPRIALRTMPEPAAVLAASFADIDALFASLAADDDGVASIRAESVELVEMLGPVLRGGSLGLLAYPDPGGGEPLWAAFAATHDHDAALAAVEKAVADAPVEVRVLASPRDARLWQSPSEGVVLGIRNGVVYAGNAVERVVATVRGEAEGHEPAISGDAVLELDVSLAGVLGPLGAVAPRALTEGGITGRVDVDGDVLVGTIRRTGGGETSWLGEAIAWGAFESAMDAVRAARAEGIEKARTDVESLHDLAILYATKTRGRIPSIEDLLEPDAGGHPYLEGVEAPVDPWGNPYLIRRLEGRSRFEVLSFGPDGLEDTADDVVHPARR